MKRLVPLVLLFVGCAHRFPAQYDLEALRADSEKRPGDALVHYLTRANADVSAACDAANFTRVDSELVGPFVASLETRGVERWSECAKKLLPSLPAESRVEFVERVAKLVPDFVERGEVTRLRAVNQLLADRPREPVAALDKLATKELASDHPDVRALVSELRALIQLEAGTVNGVKLTEDAVQKIDDEALLRRISARVPDEKLRLASRRTIVRQHIAKSTMREVKERAAEVEAAVLATGRWAQPLSSLAVPAPQPTMLVPVDVRFTQDIASQLAAPFIVSGENRRTPEIDLRPLVRFHVGWSTPLPLCDSPDALEVSPCVDSNDVKLGTGFASLDANGTLHLLEKWAMADAIDLTRAGLGIVVPLNLGTNPSQVLQIPLTAMTPNSFCFEAASTNHGPNVNAIVEPVTQGLLVEAVDERNQRVQFVLPRAAVAFEFGSCGGEGLRGSPGARGANGMSGYPGHSGSCPGSPGGRGGNGGNGYPGGRGGDGGPGGDGGAMRVELRCKGACEDEALVRNVFRSRGGRGGEGGPGGAGGSGGPGGAGGAGASCYSNGRSSSVASGSSGSQGSPGAQGPSGNRGQDGHDGPVLVELR